MNPHTPQPPYTAPKQRMHPLAAGAIGAVIGVVLTLLVLFLVAMVDDSTQGNTSSDPATRSEPGRVDKQTEPTNEPPQGAAIGDAATSGGAVVTVHDVVESPAPDGVTGGKLVTVNVTVENDGTVPMDLTCSLPLHIALFDEKQRQFEPVDSLYEVEGNPECNESLAPGFAAEMSYPFVMPEDSTPSQFGFADVESGLFGQFTLVELRS